MARGALWSQTPGGEAGPATIGVARVLICAGIETTPSRLLFCAIAQLSRMTAQGGRLEPQIPLQD